MLLYNFLVWQWCARLCGPDHLRSCKPCYALLCFLDIYSTDIKLSLNRYNLLEEYWTPNLHLPLDTFLIIPIKNYEMSTAGSLRTSHGLCSWAKLSSFLHHHIQLTDEKTKKKFKNMTNIAFAKNHVMNLTFTVSSCPRTRGMQRLLTMTMEQGRNKQKLSLYLQRE